MSLTGGGANRLTGVSSGVFRGARWYKLEFSTLATGVIHASGGVLCLFWASTIREMRILRRVGELSTFPTRSICDRPPEGEERRGFWGRVTPFNISKKNSDPTPVVAYCIVRTTIMVADKCSDNLHHEVLLGQRVILYDWWWRVPFSATTL